MQKPAWFHCRPASSAFWLWLILPIALCAAKERTFNVFEFGARGDGSTLDTVALNKAIQACADAGGGQVLIPPGRYLSGTIHLRSGVTMYLSAGAVVLGTTNLAEYTQPEIPASMPEAKWGKWHRALIVGQDVSDAGITGPGVVDGNRVFDPTGEERMRGPHTIVLVNCRRITFRDFSIRDSANYAMFFQVSDELEIRNMKFTGGWDGVHFRGSPDRWCHNVKIVGCSFYTGDDSIAGRYWDNTLITDCIINSSCNGIRLIGPARKLLVEGCLFVGPGEEPHRSSGRTNMLSGIILQPGAWDATQGLLDDVFLANNTMRDVASPVTIWTKPGNPVGKITIDGLRAIGVYRAGISAESWSDLPITNVIVRNVSIEFAGGGTAGQAKQAVKGPGVDARVLPAWAFYLRNVANATLEDSRLSVARAEARPPVAAEDVQNLTLDNVRFQQSPGGTDSIVTNNVLNLTIRQH